MQEVSGSIPLTSTNKPERKKASSIDLSSNRVPIV